MSSHREAHLSGSLVMAELAQEVDLLNHFLLVEAKVEHPAQESSLVTKVLMRDYP